MLFWSVVSAGFHFKGNGCEGLVDFVNEQVPGGLSAVIAKLPDDASRAFLQQPFISSGWYDIMPLVPITAVCATLKRQTHGLFLRDWANYQATRDGNGIYRILLKLVTPDMLVNALPRTVRRYFDFVTTEAKREGPRKYTLSITGIPANFAEIYSLVTEVFVTRALAAAGAENPRVTTSAPMPAGEAHGSPIVRFERQIVWS